MKWRVLVSAPCFLPVMEAYRADLAHEGVELIPVYVDERLTEEDLLPIIGDIDGMICGEDCITDRVLEVAPRLKVISKWGTGVDSIDQEAALRRGIRIYRTPDAFTDPVADSALGYVLLFARQLFELDHGVRKGKWEKRQLTSLREATLGVIGIGNIGKAVIRRAVVFGMRVLGNDILEIPSAFILETGLVVASIAEVLQQSNFVSLHCDLNPTSFHLIGEHELSMMKPTAYLINTARGSVIDEPALVKALQKKKIRGAALDVFEVEPLPFDSPLRTLSNCFLAPHNANGSTQTWRRVHENTIRNLLDGLKAGRQSECHI